jgi:hypothetical protein
MRKLSDRQKFLNKAPLQERHFKDGMYAFTMFMIDYFSRVESILKIDYESFMIIQITVSHVIHQSNKREGKKNYLEMEFMWQETIDKSINTNAYKMIKEKSHETKNYNKLTVSSICLILNLPKETVRRKVLKLVKKKILLIGDKSGIIAGEAYQKIFSNFVPTTVIKFSRMMKTLEKNGTLKALLNLNTKDL